MAASPTFPWQVATGTYTGDGVDDRAIAVGFQPTVVMIKRSGPQGTVVRTSTMVGDVTKMYDGANPLQTDRIQSLTATGFTIGTANGVNAAGTQYSWVAFRSAPARMVVADEQELRSAPGIVALARAYLAQVLGDVATTRDRARQALDLMPEDDHLWRGGAAVLLALTHWAAGDLEEAQHVHDGGVASLERTGDISLAISAAYDGADLRKARAQFEARHIRAVLRQHEGNVSHAARALGLSRAMLQKKMKDYELR